MSRLRTRAAILLVLAVGLPGLATPVAAAAVKPRASITQIYNDVMCVACHESLAVAQSPEAYSERQYIRTLVAQGETRQQIEHNLVEQYGPSVLALPPAHGFNVLVYVIPPLVVLLGLGTLAYTLPRWRRRTRANPAQPLPSAPPLDQAESDRLNEDLARHV
ncbi:MAG: cytochrome c-type biogenesis protein CcmH [Solirubrobacteraceae bacterium]